MSWVIVRLPPSGDWRDGEPMMEVFNAATAARVKPAKAKAVPIVDWLAELQHKINAGLIG